MFYHKDGVWESLSLKIQQVFV